MRVKLYIGPDVAYEEISIPEGAMIRLEIEQVQRKSYTFKFQRRFQMFRISGEGRQYRKASASSYKHLWEFEQEME